MTTDSIQLLPAYVDEPTHSYAASDDKAQVVDVEYTDITLEQNDLSNQDGSGCPYIRVGTDYYREVLRPQANGTTCKCLVYWKASTIKADFGKDYLNDIPKYDCFCTVPSHTDYRKIIGNAYNLYGLSRINRCREAGARLTACFAISSRSITSMVLITSSCCIRCHFKNFLY